MERINETNKRANIKNPKYGTIIINGKPRIYTDIIKDPAKFPFGDIQVLYKGLKSKASFTKPNF